MTPPDSGEHRAWCSGGRIDRHGTRLGCDCKPDSGEREVPKLRRVPDWLLRQMIRDFRFAASENGFDCGPYMKPGQHANWCGTFGSANCPMCAPLANWESQIPEAQVSLPLPLAQRILAALECMPTLNTATMLALADELRAVIPTSDLRKGP